jgi:hypothetical protein
MGGSSRDVILGRDILSRRRNPSERHLSVSLFGSAAARGQPIFRRVRKIAKSDY